MNKRKLKQWHEIKCSDLEDQVKTYFKVIKQQKKGLSVTEVKCAMSKLNMQ